MMKTNSKLVGAIVAVCVAAIPAAASAERVAVMPVSGINIHEGYLAASQDVFRGHLLATGRYEVVAVPGDVGATEAGAADSIAQGRQLQANLAAVLHVTRLGSTARVRLTVYSVATGQVVYRDQLAAATPDDIDPVLARMAKGMATGRPAADTADIETVTEREADPLLKRSATSTFGVKLGFVMPQNTPDSDAEAAIPGGSVFWLYDVRTFLAEIDFGFHAQGGDGDVWVGLGTYYPFNKENVAPYIGGGLKWIAANYGGEGESGIQLYGSFGVIIGRLSTVQLRGEVSYFANTFAEREPMDKGTSKSYTHGLLFNAGIGF
jgi:hypothetical protein